MHNRYLQTLNKKHYLPDSAGQECRRGAPGGLWLMVSPDVALKMLAGHGDSSAGSTWGELLPARSSGWQDPVALEPMD